MLFSCLIHGILGVLRDALPLAGWANLCYAFPYLLSVCGAPSASNPTMPIGGVFMAIKKQCKYCHDDFYAMYSAKRFCSRTCADANKRLKRQEEIAHEFGVPIFTLLYDLYCIQGLGVKQIAKQIGVSDRNLWEWFNNLGIERRDRSDAVRLQWLDNDERKEAQSKLVQQFYQSGHYDRYALVRAGRLPHNRKNNSESKQGPKNWMYGRCGSRNPWWNGGKVYYYGPNWQRQRSKARKRDNYTCQECGITEIELGQQLAVHHIVKFREFGIKRYKEANALTNLVCLCRTCHPIIENQST